MKKHACLGRYVLAGFIFVMTISTNSFANNITIGRYLSVAEKPKAEQLDLLEQRIQIKFPQNILTIKQAMQFVLQFSGYHLCPQLQLDQSAIAMLNQPLPEVDRNFGPMNLEQALQTLSGNMFFILADPVNRLIGFKLKPVYLHLYKYSLVKKLKNSKEENKL